MPNEISRRREDTTLIPNIWTRRIAFLSCERVAALLFGLMTLSSTFGCALFSFTHPATPAKKDPTPMVSSDTRAPMQSISVTFDEKGVPSIFARSDEDASYALGILHARDRLFQLEVVRHASQGKLTELFGDAFVETDRQLRLLSWHLDEQVKMLSDADRKLMTAYVLGINDGAEESGRTAELHILGRAFLPFVIEDIVAIGRLHAWERSFGLQQELSRARILTRMPQGDSRREALLAPVSAKDASILAPKLLSPSAKNETEPKEVKEPSSSTNRDGTQKKDPIEAEGPHATSKQSETADVDGGISVEIQDGGTLEEAPPGPAPNSAPASEDGGVKEDPTADAGNRIGARFSPRATGPSTNALELKLLAAEEMLIRKTRARAQARKRGNSSTKEANIQALLAQVGLGMNAGSNAFVVDGTLSTHRKPILVADPHLRHTNPPAFYTVRIHIGEEVHVSGVTRPGLPMVLMGATENMAWALTSSWIDTIDLVRIDRVPGSPSVYTLDNKQHIFERHTHRYLSQGQTILTEQTLSTSFGPVLPGGYEHLLEPSEALSVLWTGFDGAANSHNVSSMWALLRAKSLGEASSTAAKVGAPTENLLLAFSTGDIGYRLMGQVPKRRSAAPTDQPRQGRNRDAGWDGFISKKARPRLDNPPWHFIVNANQRIAPDGYPTIESLGRNGDLAHRAQRLQSRLAQLRGRSTGDALLSLQMDITSMQALDLSAALGKTCPKKLVGFDDKRVHALCEGLRTFDGSFWRNSLGALVFSRTLESLFEEVLATHLGPDIGRQLLRDPAVVSALEHAVVVEAAGEESPLFDDRRTSHREGLDGFMRKAVVIALDRLEDEVGKEPRQWQWGKVHYLQVNGPLHENALLGWAFKGGRTQQDGHYTAVRAESGTPITRGASLRLLAEMTTPTEISLVLDLGQSGHRFHENERDQFGEWNSALPIPRWVTPNDPRVEVRGEMLLVPAVSKR
ncbi:MAG: penicillin acylase family protein [Deltaproteobacteria bacterium]|nr:penicillin acylase family protein [Deltaproteobacteria bacterium]